MDVIQHIPVLRDEAIDALNPQFGKTYLDLTLGGGGHSQQLASCLDNTSTLIGIDQDPVALERAQQKLNDVASKVILLHGNFGNVKTLLAAQGIFQIDGGVVMDLGVSDFQIKTPERGFSFRNNAPLDMRMNPNGVITAADIVNTWSEKQLADLFYENGDEKLSRPIARTILAERPIKDTLQLAKIAEYIYKQKGIKAQNIHPATRIFQALRMAVNQEKEVLEACLNQLPDILSPGARVAIITFHSGEDRIVKHYFKIASCSCVCPPRQPMCNCGHVATFKTIGKPIFASDEESSQNPQARSAKLRIAERI